MMLKNVVLCIITLIEVTNGFYASLQCPVECFCMSNFTDCKYNDFSKLPSGLDPNMNTLDLSYNKFENFPVLLNNFSSLVQLNLSHNNIKNINFNDLRNLKNLERLDLTYNQIGKYFNVNPFHATTQLLFLDFSHNPIGILPTQLSIPSLKILRLNNCSIENMNNRLLEKLPKLEELQLAGNPIKELRTKLISHSLKFLDLSRCHLTFIDRSVFSELTSLETIWIHHNPDLKRFACDSQSLKYVDLSDCNLESVPVGNLPHVIVANFHGNHFRTILKDSFKNYTDLKLLQLSYNAILSIEPSAFSGLSNLQKVDLSQNTLVSLSNDLFETNKMLKVLNLSRNYFSKVQSLASNSLENLDLSSCEIQSIEFDSFIDMPSLRVANLSKNIISVLPDDWQAENLVILDVSLCRIKNINNKTFAGMPSLRQVNLAGNRLTSASPASFTQVISLDISDNPWRCDCTSLKPLYIWLTQTGKKLDGLYCQSPEKFEGWSWQSACQKEWTPDLGRNDAVWWYTTGLMVAIFMILFMVLAMRRVYLLKEKRIREANMARRAEEREALRRMQRSQTEIREEADRNAPDPRELQRPPSYTEALLLPRLDSSHPSLAGSMHSLASKHSMGSLSDLSKRNRPRRKRRRRKSDSSEGHRASRVVVDSDSSEAAQPQPRPTLESDV